MSAKWKGRGKGLKGKATPNEALESRTTSTSVQSVIREPKVNTPQNPDRTTNPTTNQPKSHALIDLVSAFIPDFKNVHTN